MEKYQTEKYVVPGTSVQALFSLRDQSSFLVDGGEMVYAIYTHDIYARKKKKSLDDAPLCSFPCIFRLFNYILVVVFVVRDARGGSCRRLFLFVCCALTGYFQGSPKAPTYASERD